MAYVSLSRVRSLGGLRFQRHCPSSLECAGCPRCACQLQLQHIRAHADVQLFYRLVGELEAAVCSASSSLHEAGYTAEAARLRGAAPVEVLEIATSLADRIDVPLPARQIAGALRARASALNPGERGEASGQTTGRGRKGTGIEGWWNVAPLSDAKTQRAL